MGYTHYPQGILVESDPPESDGGVLSGFCAASADSEPRQQRAEQSLTAELELRAVQAVQERISSRRGDPEQYQPVADRSAAVQPLETQHDPGSQRAPAQQERDHDQQQQGATATPGRRAAAAHPQRGLHRPDGLDVRPSHAVDVQVAGEDDGGGEDEHCSGGHRCQGALGEVQRADAAAAAAAAAAGASFAAATTAASDVPESRAATRHTSSRQQSTEPHSGHVPSHTPARHQSRVSQRPGQRGTPVPSYGRRGEN